MFGTVNPKGIVFIYQGMNYYWHKLLKLFHINNNYIFQVFAQEQVCLPINEVPQPSLHLIIFAWNDLIFWFDPISVGETLK